MTFDVQLAQPKETGDFDLPYNYVARVTMSRSKTVKTPLTTEEQITSPQVICYEHIEAARWEDEGGYISPITPDTT